MSIVGFIVGNTVEFVNVTMNMTMNPTNSDKASENRKKKKVLGESLMAVKKDYKISRVVMVITRKILNLLRVAGGHE